MLHEFAVTQQKFKIMNRLPIIQSKLSKTNKSYSRTFNALNLHLLNSRTFNALNLHLLNSSTFKDLWVYTCLQIPDF